MTTSRGCAELCPYAFASQVNGTSTILHRDAERLKRQLALLFVIASHPAENRSFALSDLKPEFHAKLDGLRQYMSEILINPHKFGGRDIIGGATLQHLVMKVCAAVSECKAVKPLRYLAYHFGLPHG